MNKENSKISPNGKERPPILRVIDRNQTFLVLIGLLAAYSFLVHQMHFSDIGILFGCMLLLGAWYMFREGHQSVIAKHIVRKECDKALAKCESVLRRFPNDSYALASAAIACLALRQYEKGVEYADKTMATGVHVPRARMIKIHCLIGLNRIDEAEKELMTALPTVTGEIETSLRLVQLVILEKRGNLELAVEHLRKLLQPPAEEIPEYKINLAYYLGRLGSLDEAQQALDAIADSSPTINLGYKLSNQSRIYLLKDEKEKAVQTSTKAVSHTPQEPPILATHGLMLLRNERLEEAKAAFDEAIKLDSTYNETFWFRAELHEKMGNKEEAEKDRKVATDWGYIPYL